MNQINKPIDYRDLLKEDEPSNTSDGSQTTEEEDNLLTKNKKRFSLDSFRDWWTVTDNKVKWELIILLVVVVLSIAVFSYYIILKTAKPNFEDFPIEGEEYNEEFLIDWQAQ